MSTLTLTSKKIHSTNTRPDNKALSARASELFWFSLSLLLFLAMGPFAAVPALIGLFSLKTSDEAVEPDAERRDDAEGAAF